MRSIYVALLVGLALIPNASEAATISVVDKTNINCIDGGFSTSCNVNEIQTSLGLPGGFALGQTGDTFEITVLFPGFINDPEQRYKILHLGPVVGLSTSGGASQLVSSAAIFTYDVVMSLTDIHGNPITSAVPIMSQACNFGGCGWSGSPARS